MANVKITKDGYGQLERNRVQTHNVEAQCAIDATAFPNGAEVGSIVAVDKPAGKIKLTGNVYGLLANAERLYNPAEMGLKNYFVKPGDMGVVIFPEVGNTWTTNTVEYDNAAYANGLTDVKAALANASAVYGVQDATTGYTALVSASTNAPGGLVLQVVDVTTMPDGQDAIKFIVVKK